MSSLRMDVRELEVRVPLWAKVAAVALSLISVGFAGHDFLSAQRDLQPRIEVVEKHVEEAEPLLKYLVCEDLAENTSACVFILRDSPYFEEFQSLGLLEGN